MIFRLFFALVFAASLAPAQAGTVRAGAATNFVVALDALARVFHEETGHKVDIMTGSTGGLYAQISQGSPVDIFFAADTQRPKLLEEADLILPGSRATYARGQLSLWAPGSGFGPALSTNQVAIALRENSGWRIAIANPQLAPYGAAAQQVMQAAGLPMTGVVYGQNVGQAYAFVVSGSAQAGFVARSQVVHKGPQDVWPVPARLHSPIDQDMVLLKRAQRNDAAKAFHAFVLSAQAEPVLRATGYLPVAPAP